MITLVLVELRKVDIKSNELSFISMLAALI